PSFARACAASPLRSNTTHWWPARNSRRTMFAPILPSPIIPICISRYLSFRRLPPVLVQSLFDSGDQFRKARLDVLAEVDAEGAAIAFAKHLEVASRLRRLDRPEGVLLPWHLHVGRIIAGDLQEHAAVRPALVRLAGRMQEARAEAQAGGNPLAVANRVT